jgi:hypothetical protein
MLPVPTLPEPDEDPGADHSGVNRWAAWYAQMYADVAKSLRGVALQGALPIQIGYDDGGRELGQNGSQQISRSAGRLLGWSIRETSGAAVNLVFNDVDESSGGNASHGPLVGVTGLAANGHENEVIVPTSFSDGLAVTFTGSGFVFGVVLLGGVD